MTREENSLDDKGTNMKMHSQQAHLCLVLLFDPTKCSFLDASCQAAQQAKCSMLSLSGDAFVA